MSEPIVPLVIIQGGAGLFDPAFQETDNLRVSRHEEGVVAAARAGHAAMTTGGTAVDAVEAAVREMESNPAFNCGRGSYLTLTGHVEMDAALQDGRTLRAGAVACVRGVMHPISAARAVMDKSDHVMFVGGSAREFAEVCGCEVCEEEELITERARQKLTAFPGLTSQQGKDLLEQWGKKWRPLAGEHDTVGAVAVDAAGNVAYATSTGGMTGKFPGRVGDSPLLGCGGAADNECGAVSATGTGETFVKVTFAAHVLSLLRQGGSAQEVAEAALASMVKRVGGSGGCVIVTPRGDWGMHFTTPGMSWAAARGDTIQYGALKGVKKTVAL